MYAAALIDHHPILRLGLARILSKIAIIREVRTYDPEYLAARVARAEPGQDVHILLFGLSDDRKQNQDLLEQIVELISPRSILLLSDTADDPGIIHPFISGHVRKTASFELIEAAVRLVLAGGRCFPAADSQALAAHIPTEEGKAGDRAAEPEWPNPSVIAASARSLRITPRQFQILMLRARGYSHRTVGQMLSISEATVKAHASAMYRRLNVRTRQEAVAMARAKGIDFLFPPEDDKNRS